jgi:hypothetical protein
VERQLPTGHESVGGGVDVGTPVVGAGAWVVGVDTLGFEVGLSVGAVTVGVGGTVGGTVGAGAFVGCPATISMSAQFQNVSG